MAFKPEPMQRTVVISSRGYQKTVIETLHALEAAHLVDFEETREGEFADFRIGRPLPEGGAASERLVKLRALIRALGLEGRGASRTFPVSELDAALASQLPTLERDVYAATDSRVRVSTQRDALAEEEARLAPLAAHPLGIDDYTGYESLAVFVGYTATPVDAEIRRLAPDAIVLPGSAETPLAAFVPRARAEAVSDVLYKNGFREHPVPPGAGPVPERLRAIAAERDGLQGRLVEADRALAALRERHADFLIAAEEHLSIEVAKADAPLGFATTENAFVVEAWVPTSRLAEVRQALDRATGGNVYVQNYEHVAHAMTGMDDMHGGADAHDLKAGNGHAHEKAPPTLMRHGAAVKPFGFFTEMFSMPKYDEIDPTAVLAVAFPLFLGVMIGDLGLGAVMALLGFFMARRLGHIEGLKELGVAIAVAGVVAAVVGGVVFQDAFGMPFGAPAQELHHLEHEGLLAHTAAGWVLTASGAVDFHGTEGEVLTCMQFAAHVGEWPWTCTFDGKHAAVTETHPILTKLGDQQTILLLSILAAIVHLSLGLLFGLRNEWGHGWKHPTAKVSWLVILFALIPAVLYLLAPEKLGMLGLDTGSALKVTGVGVLIGGVALAASEGVIGVLEIPSMLSNLLSYLRIGAVAIAKGAMAVAFNKLTIVDIAVLKGGAVWLVIGFVAFLLVQVLLFILGVLSSGIQAIRLNYVEFFTKFYKGGGEKFTPFGHARRYSVVGPSVGGGKL